MPVADVYFNAKKAKPTRKNPYARATPALPVPNPEPMPGQVQPDNPVVIDPLQAQMLSYPIALSGMPRMASGPGAQDLRTDKFSLDVNRGKAQNVYQDPLEYETHLDTVKNSSLMRELAQGAEKFKNLREDFLRNAPVQTDLTPVMAFADFLAKGKGHAQNGYHRPMNEQELVAQLSDLMGTEQKARQNMAQLAYEQAGGLKKGEEQGAVKSGTDQGRVQGFKIPHPSMGNPANNAARFLTTFDNTPVAKDASQALISANAVKSHLSNPNWLGDSAARAAIIQAMRLSPVSNRDVEQITGSRDLFNQFDQLFRRLNNGDVFTPNDRRTVEKYADYLQKKADANLKVAADEYANSHGPMYGWDPTTARNLLTPALPKVQTQDTGPKGPSLIEQMLKEELNK